MRALLSAAAPAQMRDEPILLMMTFAGSEGNLLIDRYKAKLNSAKFSAHLQYQLQLDPLSGFRDTTSRKMNTAFPISFQLSP